MQDHGQAVDPNLVQLADAYQTAVGLLQVSGGEGAAADLPGPPKRHKHTDLTGTHDSGKNEIIDLLTICSLSCTCNDFC